MEAEKSNNKKTVATEQNKEEKFEIEKRDLLNRVVSGNIENVKDRVAYILNNFHPTRNSDLELAWTYWKTFESEILNGHSITKQQLINLTKISSLSRVRAKIQNEYKLFQADDIIKKFRGVLEEEKKNQAIEDKPSGLGIYSVFIDETGKTQDFISIGSIWVLSGGSANLQTTMKLRDWRIRNDINYEFHFSKVNQQRLSFFKEFFNYFLSLNPTIGFKIIVIKNTGFSDKNSIITDLTYHLLLKGITHENRSGRAPLPRNLQVWIDNEESGSDKLKLENIKDRISSQKIPGLYLENFEAVSSFNNYFIQAVDLFTGSINRKLHYPNGNNFKDELADFILTTIGFDINLVDKNNSAIDNSVVFNLR